MSAKVSRHFSVTILWRLLAVCVSWNFDRWQNLVFLRVHQLSLSMRFWHCSSLFDTHNTIVKSIISSFSILTRLKWIHLRSIRIEIVVSGRRLIPKNNFSILLICSWSSFVETKEFFLWISNSLFIICLTHIFNFAYGSFFISCDRRFSATALNISHGWI